MLIIRSVSGSGASLLLMFSQTVPRFPPARRCPAHIPLPCYLRAAEATRGPYDDSAVMQIAFASVGPRDLPDRWSVEARPEVSRPEPPERSPWPVIVGGLIVTAGSIVVLGAVFTLAF